MTRSVITLVVLARPVELSYPHYVDSRFGECKIFGESLFPLLGRLAEKLTGRGGDATWSLPNGLAAERFGERESDLALAWPREDSGTIDEERIRRRWPESVRIRRLGERVYLVGGVEARSRLPVEAASNPDDSVDSIEAVERLVEATRGSGDRRVEALALADLGALVLNAGDAGLAVARLRRALDL